MIKGSLLTAWLLVFMDCVKELQATLPLRRFNFDALATRVHESTAPILLLIMLVGSIDFAVPVRATR